MIWDEISLLLNKYIIRNENDLYSKIQNFSKLNIMDNKSLISQLIDFDDAEGNSKIVYYLNTYLKYFHFSKDQAIDKANKKFIQKWGNKSLVFSRKKSNYNFKSFI